MHDDLSNQPVVIITGSSKGLGMDLVNSFLEVGYRVVSCGRSEMPDKLQHENHRYLRGDASKEEFHNELLGVCEENFGMPNYYLNNVGLSHWKPLSEVDDDFLSNMIDINLKTVFWGCKAAQKSKKLDAILNISSLAGKRGSANNSVYCATKFAVNGVTQSLAKELGPENIRVNALCPVLIETPGLLDALSMTSSPAQGTVPKKFMHDFAVANSALKRLPSSREVSEAAIFLLSQKASGITGQCMNIDCGVFPQ